MNFENKRNWVLVDRDDERERMVNALISTIRLRVSGQVHTLNGRLFRKLRE